MIMFNNNSDNYNKIESQSNNRKENVCTVLFKTVLSRLLRDNL